MTGGDNGGGGEMRLRGTTAPCDLAELEADAALAELRDTPVIDVLFLVLMGNNLPIFKFIWMTITSILC
jgi:formylmethanofuran dehydrogenase subunit A